MKVRNIFLGILSVFILTALPSISSAFIVSGLVWDDVNCNGTKNTGEAGLSGVIVTMSPGAYTSTTSATGVYQFLGVPPGTYTITEWDPSGYCSTTPNSRVIRIKISNIGGQLFGDSVKYVSPPGGCCP